MLPGVPNVPRRLLPAGVAIIVLLGCTPGATSSGSDPDEPSTGEQPAATVTIPPVRLTPFCQEMIDLAERLEVDPPDDVTAEIVETYERIDAEVPDAIREDFDAVLAGLRGEPTPAPSPDDQVTTSAVPPVTDESGSTVPSGDPFFDEGYDPDDDPALRLNTYVDFECRGVANNPGPPATQPLSEPTTTDG